MPTETNVYSRNLKVISIFYIVYWLLGLHLQENVLALGAVRFKIDDPHWLPYIANSLLLYFAWRFHIHSRKKVLTSYRRFFCYEFLSYSPPKHPDWSKKLIEAAERDFVNSGFKAFQEKNAGDFFDNLTAAQCRIRLPSLTNQGSTSKFQYTYDILLSNEAHEARKTEEAEKTNGQLKPIKGSHFTFKFNLFLKLSLNIHMFTLWLISEEDSADYLIPWVLFVVALVSIFLRSEEHLATTLTLQCPQPTGGYPLECA